MRTEQRSQKSGARIQNEEYPLHNLHSAFRNSGNSVPVTDPLQALNQACQARDLEGRRVKARWLEASAVEPHAVNTDTLGAGNVVGPRVADVHGLVRAAAGGLQRCAKYGLVGFATGKFSAYKHLLEKRGEPGGGKLGALHCRCTVRQQAEVKSSGKLL